MQVAILAAAQGYNIEQIKPWVTSLQKTNFKGLVGVVLYDRNEELAAYLSSHGVHVFTAVLDGLTNIATQRFKDYIQMMQLPVFAEVDWFLHTDIRDVVFQQDPTLFLQNQTQGIIATGEGVTFKHEDWNGEGMQFNYGEAMYQSMADLETMCSGIIAGRKNELLHLFQTIYDLAFYTPNPEGFADQHYYNVALRKVYSSVTEFVSADTAWVANLGTLIALPMLSPMWSTNPRTPNSSYERMRSGTYVDNMLVGLPQLIDGQICTPSGEPYIIVHQYDRYQPWKEVMLQNLGGVKTPSKVTESTDLGFYMWAYENVENVDYIFTQLRKSYPQSDIVLSSDAGEDFSDIAQKYGVVKYIHGTENHGYPSQKGRWGWTKEQAKLWLDRFYEACQTVTSPYLMMMDEDVLVKQQFDFLAYDMVMTPNIKNPISRAGMEWIKSRGGVGDYPYYSFGGGSVLRVDKFIQAYENHRDSFFAQYEDIFQKSLSENIGGWGWNDCMLCSLMYAENATFSTNLPVIESGIEDDPAPIIHKFKKYYRK